MIKKKYCHFCGYRLTEKEHEGRMRLFCHNCNLAIYENPVPATCLVTIDDHERLLLVKRSVDPKKGWWCLPGGFMELQETPEEAGLRELAEETGLAGKIDMLLGVTSNHSASYDTVLLTGFLIRSYSGTLYAGDDADDARWFKYENLPEIAFDSHKKFITMYYSAYAYTDASNS
ncbi:MAG: NUDIX domain-containing protein [Desulfobacteraceae bacterium]|nr:NUDIX domain-containing protein [Desulfobacteraceae bacterium]